MAQHLIVSHLNPLTKLQQVNQINTLSINQKKVTTIDAEIIGDADRERYNNNVIRDDFKGC